MDQDPTAGTDTLLAIAEIVEVAAKVVAEKVSNTKTLPTGAIHKTKVIVKDMVLTLKLV
jgi:hypothetical protein